MDLEKVRISRWHGMGLAENGNYGALKEFDIIAGPIDDSEERAGLSGFIQVIGEHCRPIIKHMVMAKKDYDFVIDLFKVPRQCHREA